MPNYKIFLSDKLTEQEQDACVNAAYKRAEEFMALREKQALRDSVGHLKELCEYFLLNYPHRQSFAYTENAVKDNCIDLHSTAREMVRVSNAILRET